MNLPADIPSYLSSQGTLSEPQEGYSNSEAGSHQQLMPPAGSYVHKGTDGKQSPHVYYLCFSRMPVHSLVLIAGGSIAQCSVILHVNIKGDLS